MNTKILYLLISGPADVYMEQAYVSAYSAARLNPDASLVLLTDTATDNGWLKENPLSAAFKALFSEIVVAPLDPDLPAMQRSRLLKTGMREYVKGDFLFIDADTLVQRPLAGIDDFQPALAAVPDLHSTFAEHPHRRATLNMCKKLRYDASGDEYYFNSGVLLVRDTSGNHSFFKQWQKNYLAGYKKGIRPDQPSLAKTNENKYITRMPDAWNCEVQNGVRYLKDAFIIHYMVTNISAGQLDRLYLLNDPEVMLRMRHAGQMTDEILEVVKDPFKGYAPVTQVFAGKEIFFFRTRRYRWMRGRYLNGKRSFLEFLLKVRDHLTKKK